MRKTPPPNAEESISDLLNATLRGFTRLAVAHVRLARIEFKQDLTTQLRSVTALAIGVSFATLGYLMLCVSLGLFISRWAGLTNAFLIVGAAHLAVGTFAAIVGMRSLREMNWMSKTISEMNGSVSMLTTKAMNAKTRPGAKLGDRVATTVQGTME